MRLQRQTRTSTMEARRRKKRSSAWCCDTSVSSTRTIMARPRPSSGLTTTILFVLVSLFIQQIIECRVEISELKVPQYIENGTVDSVVLDCAYTYDPIEDRQVVVKWFFNEDSEPIYQWIFELNTRHVPAKYKARVNADYVVNTTDPWQRYRALNLIKPTVEFTGSYSCHVDSMLTQNSKVASMIVYAKTKSVNLSTRRVTKERSTALQQTGAGNVGVHRRPHSSPSPSPSQGYPHGRYHERSRKPAPLALAAGSAASLSSADFSALAPHSPSPPSSPFSSAAGNSGSRFSSAATTEVQCAVHNVFPLPELTIYQILHDGLRPRSLENARLVQNITPLRNGAFDVSVTAYIEDIELLQQQQQPSLLSKHSVGSKPTLTMFECLVSQDQLRHELRQRTLYTITHDETEYDSGGEAAAVMANRLLFSLLFILSLLLFV